MKKYEKFLNMSMYEFMQFYGNELNSRKDSE